ncbi:phage tail assembly protein [Bradyrhizobium neotropicale]|uniref:phage tail assembly protein n=1 Tax=Bradyrhizobium neotropicale TaxID=1497615 RepID=UPI001AD733AE|nr:phage tail assembly protein [Bradyrhizobium neotropicale]MBO4221953.1 hypothetical protein [Bradyrhizobium neotropicale]
MVDVTPERDDKPAERKQRAMPPPEIEASPAEEGQPDEQLQDAWPMVVPLYNKPIRNNKGEMVKEVKLREPRAADINRYGNPCRYNGDGEPVIQERKMTYMIAALADILPPFIEDMDPRDWNTCAMKLQRFFLPDLRAW